MLTHFRFILLFIQWNLYIARTSQCRSSHGGRSGRKGVLRNFPKFTGKHLCQNFIFNKVAGPPGYQSEQFFGKRLNYSQTLILKPLYSGQFWGYLSIVDTFFESGIEVLIWKNLYIVNRAEKKNMKRIKLNFDKFLYFRILKALHSCSFLTVSIFLTSLWLTKDQENDIKQEFPAQSHLHDLLFSQRPLLP